MWSHPITVANLCATISIVVPLKSSFMMVLMISSVSTSIDAVASSRNMILVFYRPNINQGQYAEHGASDADELFFASAEVFAALLDLCEWIVNVLP